MKVAYNPTFLYGFLMLPQRMAASLNQVNQRCGAPKKTAMRWAIWAGRMAVKVRSNAAYLVYMLH